MTNETEQTNLFGETGETASTPTTPKNQPRKRRRLPTLPDTYTLQEATKILGISLRALRKYRLQGLIASVKIGKTTLISKKAINDFVEGKTFYKAETKPRKEYPKGRHPRPVWFKRVKPLETDVNAKAAGETGNETGTGNE